MSNFFKEFKEFAMKGNVIDMAVGVIIGAAFGKIVSSLVDDIIMPAIGVLTGGANFSDEKILIKEAFTDPNTHEQVAAVYLNWGSFVQTIIDFVIIAFCIFVAIKMMNRLKRQKEVEAEAAAPAGPTQEELLTDIRDLLARQQNAGTASKTDADSTKKIQ